MSKHHINRRNFIKHGTCGAMASTTLFNTLVNLRASGAAAMSDSDVIGSDDYKAMVCILLDGGNDSWNMLTPYEQTEYDDYTLVRGADQNNGGVALPRQSLLTLNPLNMGSRRLGLHPSMTNIKQLFDQRKAAFVSNIGTLVEPISVSEFWAESKRVPLGLLSHSDQTQQWMTALPHERAGVGWGGRIADMINDMNPDPNLSMNISLAGTNVFQTGVNTVEYSLFPQPLDRSIPGIESYGNDWILPEQRKAAIDEMLNRTYSDIFENTYINTVRNARDGWLTYKDALENITLTNSFEDPGVGYGDPEMLYSLGWVAKMIAARETLGYKRQTFFVRYGGWDHHDEVIDAQAQQLMDVDYAVSQFQKEMEALGTDNCVVSFVISDFARTLSSNGNGTDHAWGGNVMAFGGTELIDGGKVYGTYPDTLNPNNNVMDLGGGIIVPTTSADVYFAEIAKWFGVSDSNLQTIFPNLVNFYDYQNSGHSLLNFLKTT